MEKGGEEADVRQKLLRAVKKEVKQIMEEAVTRKFIHEESSSITSLCGAVDACLLHKLKKRSLGLFKHGTTNALLQKISKNFEPANDIFVLINEQQQSSNSDSRKSMDLNKNQNKKTNSNTKYLWIRLSIFEKKLAKILDYLVQNNTKYYESEALIADPVDGPIFASLLVGPCALDYTKMKTSDHFWTDPPADELVQRHRIHSTSHHITGPGSPKRPGLQVRRNASSSSEESPKAFHLSAKEYVESLHQNSKTMLLYGKNNVMIQPREGVEMMAGYLSLHQTVEGLMIMWTPNQLMNGCCEDLQDNSVDRSIYWDYALTVYVDEIVYIHCHQQADQGGTIVLVGQDGVQRPPIHFPKGGHLLSFLTCMETGLLPNGQLDPPLWSQKGKGMEDEGKVFPRLKRKGSRLSNIVNEGSTSSTGSSSSTDEDESTDYVFRIISTCKLENIHSTMMDPKGKLITDTLPWLRKTPKAQSPVSQSPIQTYAREQEEQNNSCLHQIESNHRATIKELCDTMRKQIISRAFYGWIAHCRHLKTVRTHLSGLVYHMVVPTDHLDEAASGLTVEKWREMVKDGIVNDAQDVYQLIYYGGVSHEIRKEVWPYLLGHYKFGSTKDDRDNIDVAVRTAYEQTMSEWLAVEAIVRQRDKENIAANLAKLASVTSYGGSIPLVRKDSNLSNDVFESMDSDDFSRPETVPEESSTAGQTSPSTCMTPEPRQSLSSSSVQGHTIDQNIQTDFEPDGSYEEIVDSPDDGMGDSIARMSSIPERYKHDSAGDSGVTDVSKYDSESSVERNVIITKMSVDSIEEEFSETGSPEKLPRDSAIDNQECDDDEEAMSDGLTVSGGVVNAGFAYDNLEQSQHLSASRESLISPASPASHGGIYSCELLDNVGLNLHRIDKDVQRCDRNYWYFKPATLEKLRNIICTYVWEHLEVGYVQGMCDLVAPLLVILDDEALTFSCFCELMKRMSSNFPHGGAMDTHFANMRSLIQILDSEIFEHMHQNGDYTHFYFCYRWFLLDFKRELLYDDIFSVWETIWSAKHVSSSHFVLFIALALVEYYRDIILDNNMDFTDIIKFFNEMAERHNAKQILKLSRELVLRLQTLIDNK